MCHVPAVARLSTHILRNLAVAVSTTTRKVQLPPFLPRGLMCPRPGHSPTGRNSTPFKRPETPTAQPALSVTVCADQSLHRALTHLGFGEGRRHVLQEAGQILLTITHHQEDAGRRTQADICPSCLLPAGQRPSPAAGRVDRGRGPHGWGSSRSTSPGGSRQPPP